MLNGIESKSGLAGYMPLKSQYGFIYRGNIDALTIAHELGHVQRNPGFCDFKKRNPMVELIPPNGGSTFRLWHTFSTESDYFMPQNSSDNLMDYPDSYRDGKRLHKYQWDFIHNPEGGLYLFQDEEEAAMVADDLIEKTVKGIRDNTLEEKTELNLSDYYTTDYEYGVNVPRHGHLDFGDENKFDISYKIFNLSSDNSKNKIKISEYSEETYNRKYLNVDGECLTILFDYKDRSGTGLEMAVPVAQKDKFKDYLFAAIIELISEKSDSALLAGEDINPTSYACNIAVRAYIYYLKNDPVLFPVSFQGTSTWGAPVCCPTGQDEDGNNLYDPSSIKIGQVNWDGRANNTYDSFEEGDLNDYFEELEKGEDQTWSEFFDDIQERVNNGEIVIGCVKRSGPGHIVAFMPESLYGSENGEVKIGDDTEVIKPIALEAGGDVKEIKPFIGTNDEITRNTNPYKFYKYKK